MTPRFRFRLASTVGLSLALTLALSGCTDALNGGRLVYVQSPKLESELRVDPDLKGKPEYEEAVRKKAALKEAVLKELAELFGPEPGKIKVPKGSGLPGGGYRLANYVYEGKGKVRPFSVLQPDGSKERQAGGFALYRKHCLHCHGVSGAGDGPTAPFLYPRPRDYRKGIFKFTSTLGGQKPARDDLRKTIREGLHGTSMPAFEALMSGHEIEQVLDYMLFLTLRGETEEALIVEAASNDELTHEAAEDQARSVFNKWERAKSTVVNPLVPRTPSNPDSIARGKKLFLGRTTHKLECTGCHGPKAIGNGPSFIGQDVFNAVVFGGKISKRFKLSAGQLDVLEALTGLGPKPGEHGSESAGTHPEPPTLANLVKALETKLGVKAGDKVDAAKSKLGYEDDQFGAASSLQEVVENLLGDLEDKSLVSRSYHFHGTEYSAVIDHKSGKLWNDSLDDWENPLRPNNLNRGIYKGGRRPIDIYWRIAKGINGAKMPAHDLTLKSDTPAGSAMIWDIVNFVLALPYDPSLLDDATTPVAAAPPAVAGH